MKHFLSIYEFEYCIFNSELPLENNLPLNMNFNIVFLNMHMNIVNSIASFRTYFFGFFSVEFSSYMDIMLWGGYD